MGELKDWVAISASFIAIVISFVSLVRNRVTSNKLIELEKIHAKLSEKLIKEYDDKNH